MDAVTGWTTAGWRWRRERLPGTSGFPGDVCHSHGLLVRGIRDLLAGRSHPHFICAMIYPHGEMEEAAIRWLLLERKCVAAYTERHPTGYWRPDAIGVLSSRRVIEIEIKRTVADFRQDRMKPNVMQWRAGADWRPYQFYYMLPAEIVESCEVPDFAGVIQVRDQYQVEVVKRAPINNKANKMRPKSVAKAIRQQSLQVMAMMGDLVNLRRRQEYLQKSSTP